jgi:hypothetical protein
MPKRKFDKDIELSKVHTKIANEQVKYYTLMGALLSGGVAFEILIVSVGLSHIAYFVSDGILILFLLAATFLYLRARRQRKRFMKYFEDIYNETPIEY